MALVCALLAAPALAASIAVEGGLPRNASQGFFIITVKITGLDTEKEYKAKGSLDQNPFTDRFEIQLEDVDSANLPFTAETATANLKFYAELANSNDPDVTSGQNADTTDLTYHIKILESETGEMAAKIAENKLRKIAITFKLGGEIIIPKREFTLAVESYVVAQAPELVSILGTHQALSVNWTPKSEVTVLSGSTTATKTASSVTLYVFSDKVFPAGETVILPAKTYNPESTTNPKALDTDTTCTYTPLAEGSAGGDCVKCEIENSYVLHSAISKPGITIISDSVSAGQRIISGLENGASYTVFMQYQPDGITASKCLKGVPSPNFTLTELNGEGPAKHVDIRCFIATAAYGTPLHADLDRFRAFRDKTLMAWGVGRALVRAYYELSPPLADFIERHDGVRSYAHTALAWIAARLPSAHAAGEITDGTPKVTPASGDSTP